MINKNVAIKNRQKSITEIFETILHLRVGRRCDVAVTFEKSENYGKKVYRVTTSSKLTRPAQ